MNDALASAPTAQMVPGDFAEKAMASLMSMHTELMDEKERRVELYRKLMEREQTVAELRMYIRLLEEKVEANAEPKAPEPVSRAAPVAAPAHEMREVREVRFSSAPTAGTATVTSPVAEVSAYTREPTVAPPLPPRVNRPKVDGWKTW